MRVPRWAAGGIAIVAIGNVLWSAAVPDVSRNNPEHATHQELEERKYIQEKRVADARAGYRDGTDRAIAESNIPAEIRPADRAARQAAESAAREAAARDAAEKAAKSAIKGIR